MKIITHLALAAIVLLMAGYGTPTALAHEETTGIVVKVVDADTLKLSVDGQIANYRLAAVDAPETYNNRKAKKDIINCGIDKSTMFLQGRMASRYVEDTIAVGSSVTFAVVDTGAYGRPIIWIQPLISDLVTNGYARVVDSYDNVPDDYLRVLRSMERNAIDLKLGIWKTLDCWKP